MKFSERWLRTMVDPRARIPRALCERLTMAGLEVESSEPAAPPFSGVVVGRIDQVDPHPNADRLRVCTVDVGTARAAAHRLRRAERRRRHEGPVRDRRRGASRRPAHRRGDDARRRIAGHALLRQRARHRRRRLGPARAARRRAGRAPTSATCCELDDALITLKITPNRADCLSVLGIARDVAAVTDAPFVPPAATVAPVTSRADTRRARRRPGRLPSLRVARHRRDRRPRADARAG